MICDTFVLHAVILPDSSSDSFSNGGGMGGRVSGVSPLKQSLLPPDSESTLQHRKKLSPQELDCSLQNQSAGGGYISESNGPLLQTVDQTSNYR